MRTNYRPFLLALGLGFVLIFTSGVALAALSADQLPAVRQLQAGAAADGVELTWQPVAGCDGYRIYYGTSVRMRGEVLQLDLPAARTAYLFAGMNPAAGYSFRVAPLLGGAEGPLSFPVQAARGQNSDVAR